MRIVVAIDGPAGAGKSTVTKRLAQQLGYSLLDTGALYRAVALVARDRGVGWDDEARLAKVAAELDIRFEMEGEVNRVFLGDREVTAAIREPEISDGSSRVSAVAAVRAALLDLQRRLGERGGVVVEGRDTGTVVFPDARAKFFLTASPEVRAQRRTQELRSAGKDADFGQVLAEIRERDERDSIRDLAPLCQADDAVPIDSSSRSVDEVVAQMLAMVREREQGA